MKAMKVPKYWPEATAKDLWRKWTTVLTTPMAALSRDFPLVLPASDMPDRNCVVEVMLK